MDVPMDTGGDPGSQVMSDQKEAIAKIADHLKLLELLKKITLTQEEQNIVLKRLQEISSTFEVKYFKIFKISLL